MHGKFMPWTIMYRHKYKSYRNSLNASLISTHLVTGTTANTISIKIRCSWYVPAINGSTKGTKSTCTNCNEWKRSIWEDMLTNFKSCLRFCYPSISFLTVCAIYFRIWVICCPGLNKTIGTWSICKSLHEKQGGNKERTQKRKSHVGQKGKSNWEKVCWCMKEAECLLFKKNLVNVPTLTF